MLKHEINLGAIMLPLRATFEGKGNNSFSMKLGSSAVANHALLRYIQCSVNVPQVIEVSACAGFPWRSRRTVFVISISLYKQINTVIVIILHFQAVSL